MKAQIVLAVNHLVFIELCNAIVETLKTKDIECDINDELSDQISNYDLSFVIKGHHDFNPDLIHNTRVLIQTEELWNCRERNQYHIDNGFHKTLEMYIENVTIPGAEKAVYFPIGYHPVWEVNETVVNKDIDVLFHGSLTERRRKFEYELRKEGYNCVFTENAFGNYRERLIMRSKIIINIKAHEQWSYGPLHCLPTQANKQFLLVEKVPAYPPYKEDVHYLTYDGIDDLKEKIAFWINKPQDRKRMGEFFYENIKEIKFEDIFLNCMKGIL